MVRIQDDTCYRIEFCDLRWERPAHGGNLI